MEGLNVNVVDKEYIASHFEEEEENESKAVKSPPKKEIKPEFRGIPVAQLEHQISRLRMDMEAEIEAISSRYVNKIE